MLESAPIASVGGYKVVSVNYRMAPEATHPPRVEDVATVYRELLKTYEPKHVGIYGCSAGGALTAQTAAWLPAHDLPQAGADRDFRRRRSALQRGRLGVHRGLHRRYLSATARKAGEPRST